jgi:hypothetical protein
MFGSVKGDLIGGQLKNVEKKLITDDMVEKAMNDGLN